MRNLEKFVLFGSAYLALFLASLVSQVFVSQKIGGLLTDVLLFGFLGIDSDDSALFLMFTLTPALWLANVYLLYVNKFVYKVKSKKIFIWLSFLPLIALFFFSVVVLSIIGVIG